MCVIKKLSERKNFFMYDHANEEHGGNIPTMTIEIIENVRYSNASRFL